MERDGLRSKIIKIVDWDQDELAIALTTHMWDMLDMLQVLEMLDVLEPVRHVRNASHAKKTC